MFPQGGIKNEKEGKSKAHNYTQWGKTWGNTINY